MTKNNFQMGENERGVFSFLHGVTGMVIATLLLLIILVVLTYDAISVQQKQATNFYKIDKDLNALKTISKDNDKYYKLIGK